MSVAPTDPLSRAVTPHRVRTTPLPRLHALCGQPTPGGGLCHLASRHHAGCLPPPPVIIRPHEWSTHA